MIKNFTILSLIIASSSALAETDFNQNIQQLSKDYLVCTNVYTNTGDVGKYNKCIATNEENYENLIEQIRKKSGYPQPEIWKNTTSNMDSYIYICQEGSARNLNDLIFKNISDCKNMAFKYLAIGATKLSRIKKP